MWEGRISELSALAKEIRLKEVKLGVESVAVHIPGELNITPDALSRFFFNNSFRDKLPDRTLRKRLFKAVSKKFYPFTLDGMVADDGHNALVSDFCSPSNPLYEANLSGHVVWVFPPTELIGITLKFLINRHKSSPDFKCCLLVPDNSRAHWFRLLEYCRPVITFNSGADFI